MPEPDELADAAAHDQGDEPYETTFTVGGREYPCTVTTDEAGNIEVLAQPAVLGYTEAGVDEGAIGPPLPVTATAPGPDGIEVLVSLPAGHPAYAAVHAGLTDSLSIGPDGIAAVSDNGPSVNPVGTRQPVHASFRGAPVPSPTVISGLGRQHIEAHRYIPPPPPIDLPEALGGIPEDAPEQQRVRYNRADRRALARKMRRRS